MTEPKQPVIVRNEKTKLRATFFNSLAVSCFTVGAATPVAGYVLGATIGNPFPSIAIWLAAGIALHYTALTELEEMIEP